MLFLYAILKEKLYDNIIFDLLENKRSELRVNRWNENRKLGIGSGIPILLSQQKRKEFVGKE